MKTSREKVLEVFEHRSAGDGVMWTGNPDRCLITEGAQKWGFEDNPETFFRYLDDDCRWISADGGYRHPEGRPMFDVAYKSKARTTLSAGGCFADTEDTAEVEAYPWPDAKYCNFDHVYSYIEQFRDKMVFTGMWSCFFHIVADFFGMENYFIKMYENPAVVEAVTEHVVDFYVQANEKFFSGLGDRADVMFFGNDFGTQLDLFISPEMFRRFVMPGFKKIIAVGKKYNKKILLHSCGSIYRIIPDLIDAGVDALHPIQAQAVGMSADDLKQYKNDLAFVGGIDAQSFFVNATPEEIEREVDRVRSILGPSIVISPSHERILPNVPVENILAMARAAKK
ncbi:MAG: hypothetical protein IJC71_08275 [Clostridia bacterium]|nr:hypothetical protein [Clostridia bacterium]